MGVGHFLVLDDVGGEDIDDEDDDEDKGFDVEGLCTHGRGAS